jgi:uncharacterized protein involved in exopolysaccharide biosynthesis
MKGEQASGESENDTLSKPANLATLASIALHGIWRRRLWVAAAVIAGTLFGVLRAIITPSEYRSSGKLYVRPGLREYVSPEAAFSTAASGTARPSGSREAILNEMQVLSSSALFDLAVAKIGADTVLAQYDPTAGDTGEGPWHTRLFKTVQAWWFSAGSQSVGSALPIERDRLASAVLSRRVIIVPEVGTSVISVIYSASSPEAARDVVNGVLKAAQELHSRVFDSMAAAGKVEDEFKGAEERARAAETALGNFRIEHSVFELTEQQAATIAYSSKLAQELAELELDMAGKKAELAALRPVLQAMPPMRTAPASATSIPNPEHLAWSNLLTFLRQQLITLELDGGTPAFVAGRKKLLDEKIQFATEQLAAQKVSIQSDGYEEPNPDYVRLMQRYSDLEVALKAADSQHAHLTGQCEAQRETLAKLEKIAPTFRTLELEATQKRAAADLLATGVANMRAVKRLEQLNLSEVQIMHNATLDGTKVSPQRSRFLLFGAFGGATVGVLLTGLLALASKRVRVAADLQRLGLPPSTLLASTSDRGPATAEHARVPAELAEGRTDIAHLWSSLPYDRRGTAGLRIGVLPGDGGSAGRVAGALAAGLALYGGEKVVYVACTEGSSWLALRLGLPSQKGWATSLRQGGTDAFPGIATKIPGLDYCALGEVAGLVPHPIAGPAFVALLDRLSKSHRFVIVELPDLTSQPEARSALNVVDGVELVVNSGVDRKSAIRATLAAVTAAGARLLGCVQRLPGKRHGGQADTARS